jgi:MarR family transcriptional regulator, organic hydroperoxide resistance regulator
MMPSPPIVSRPQPAGETLQFMQRLWDLAHALDVRSKRMATTVGVTGPQRLVIRVIGQLQEPTASDIAATLMMHPSTLTGIVSRLADQGLISRTRDEEDRRRSRFKLTGQGVKVDRERRGTVEAAVRRALVRADTSTVASTVRMIGLLVAELERTD